MSLFKPNVKKMLEKKDVVGLIRVLRDEDDILRKNAAEALGKIGAPGAVEPLISALNDSHYGVSMNALKALERLRAVEALIDALNHSDRSMRIDIVKVLGDIGDPQAVEPLSAILKEDDRSLRVETAKALGKLGVPRAMEPLIGALKDGDYDVRKCAALSLEQYNLSFNLEAEIMRDMLLGNINVLSLGKASIVPLIKLLKDSNRTIRRDAAEYLGDIGDARAVEPLIAALNDSEYWVIETAAKALGKLRAVDSLIAVKLGDEYARKQVIEVLGDIGDPRAVERLIAYLDDEKVGGSAAEALGKIGDALAVEPLIAVLKGAAAHVRCKIAIALGKIGDPRAAKPLIATLSDCHNTDIEANKDAAEALVKIGLTYEPEVKNLISHARSEWYGRH